MNSRDVACVVVAKHTAVVLLLWHAFFLYYRKP